MIRFLVKNWKVKILCLAAAGALWLYVASGQTAIGQFPGGIKIKTLNMPSGLEAIYDTKVVDIKIMAEPSVWKRLSSDSFSAYIDLSGLSEGTHELSVKVTSSIPDVQIVEKDPEKIFVSLEPIIQKTVNVKAKIEGSAGTGMVAGDIKFSPETVQVKGAKSLINAIDDVIAKIRLSGETVDLEKNVAILALNEAGDPIDNLEISPDKVKAAIPIIKSSSNKTVGIKVRTTGTLKSGYYISDIATDPATIDIAGTDLALSSAKYVETYAISVEGASSVLDTEIGLNPDENIAIQPDSPTKIKVRIQIEAKSVSKSILPSISFSNTGNYSVVGYEPSIVQLVCSGDLAVISALSDGAVGVNINLSKYSLSDNAEEITVDLSKTTLSVPAGVSITNYIPSSIIVSLIKNR